VAGSYDAYIKASAQAAAAYGKQFQLRFAPEMNGSWAPWEGSVNGNTPALYVAAWRHVVSIFRAAGATNVQWVWSPNNGPTSTIASYYPGDSWVDVIGIDGYNWGSSLGSWQSFTQVFGPAYAVVTSLSAVKPIQISETASAETGGDKPAWITSAFLSEIPTSFPRLIAVIWFDENKETNWSIDSSTAALAAYRQIVASSLWGGQSWAGETDTSSTTTTMTITSSAPTTTSPADPSPTTTTVTSMSLSTPSVSVSNYGRSSVSLGWRAVSGAAGYTVEVSTSSSFSVPTDVDAGGTTATVTGLQSATVYWFRLRATAGSASSSWSSPVSVTTTGKPHR
jgi:hypothetical protein